jgi:L-malate glycosyltransferase
MSEAVSPHVLHISTPRGWRGIERQVALILDEQKRKEWPVTVLCRRGSPMRRYCRRHRIDSIPFEKRFFNRVLLGWKLYWLCRKKKYDILHVHDQVALSAAIFAWGLGMRIPVVVSRRNSKPTGWPWLLQRQLNHPAVKAIVCASENIIKELRPLVRNQEKILLVPAGIDTEKFAQEKTEGRLRREYFIGSDYTLVGNTSALAGHKDYPTFLKTAKTLLARNPKMFFLAIGDGPERGQVEKLIGQMEMNQHVKITGSRTDMHEVIQQLDLLLYTPLADDLGIAVLEAFAAGVPVVTTTAGCMPELVDHEKTGMLAPVGDAQKLAENVLKVISNADLRQEIVKGAHEKMRNYTRQKVANEMLEIYSNVFSKIV